MDKLIYYIKNYNFSNELQHRNTYLILESNALEKYINTVSIIRLILLLVSY